MTLIILITWLIATIVTGFALIAIRVWLSRLVVQNWLKRFGEGFSRYFRDYHRQAMIDSLTFGRGRCYIGVDPAHKGSDRSVRRGLDLETGKFSEGLLGLHNGDHIPIFFDEPVRSDNATCEMRVGTEEELIQYSESKELMVALPLYGETYLGGVRHALKVMEEERNVRVNGKFPTGDDSNED